MFFVFTKNSLYYYSRIRGSSKCRWCFRQLMYAQESLKQINSRGLVSPKFGAFNISRVYYVRLGIDGTVCLIDRVSYARVIGTPAWISGLVHDLGGIRTYCCTRYGLLAAGPTRRRCRREFGHNSSARHCYDVIRSHTMQGDITLHNPVTRLLPDM